MEILHIGLVDELRRAGFQHEHLHDEVGSIIECKSGRFHPEYGQRCITLWATALPSDFFTNTPKALSQTVLPKPSPLKITLVPPHKSLRSNGPIDSRPHCSMLPSLPLIISLLLIFVFSALIATENTSTHQKNRGNMQEYPTGSINRFPSPGSISASKKLRSFKEDILANTIDGWIDGSEQLTRPDNNLDPKPLWHPQKTMRVET